MRPKTACQAPPAWQSKALCTTTDRLCRLEQASQPKQAMSPSLTSRSPFLRIPRPGCPLVTLVTLVAWHFGTSWIRCLDSSARRFCCLRGVRHGGLDPLGFCGHLPPRSSRRRRRRSAWPDRTPVCSEVADVAVAVATVWAFFLRSKRRGSSAMEELNFYDAYVHHCGHCVRSRQGHFKRTTWLDSRALG